MASYKNGSITLENVYGKKTYETTIAECGSSIELQELTITQNGTYMAPDAVGYSPINVNVASTELQELTINENGTYTAPEGTGYSPVNVNVPSKEEETKSITITENGTTTVLPTSGKVLSKVDIVANVPQSAASGTVKNLLDATKSTYNLFYNYSGTSVDDLIAYDDTSNVTDMNNMFYKCFNLTTIPLLNTNKTTSMNSMFYKCSSLTTIDITNMNITSTSSVSYFADDCYSLTKLIIRNMSTIPVINTNSFNNCYHFTGTVNSTYNPDGLKDGRIYVPDDKVEELKVATNWSVYADIIVPLSTLVE